MLDTRGGNMPGEGGGSAQHRYLMLDAQDALFVDPKVGLVGVR